MSEQLKYTWLKFLVGGAAGFLGLQVANGPVCEHLAGERWQEFGEFVIGVNHCSGGSYLYAGSAFGAAYYLCIFFAEKRRRPMLGAVVALVAGISVAAVAAWFYFNNLYG